MRLMQCLRASLAILIINAVWLAGPAGSAPAQSSSSAGDQLDLLRGMSQDQQDQLLQQFGINRNRNGGSDTSSDSGRNDNGRTDDGRQSRDSQDQYPRRPLDENDQPEPLIPILRPEDWVIIEIDWHLPPRPVSPLTQGLTAGQSLPLAQQQQLLQQALANGGGAQAAQGVGQGIVAGANAPGRDTPPADLDLTEADRQRIVQMMTLIRSKNPYQLSRDGTLQLPDFAPIPLNGLTEEQATLRLKIEPWFRNVEVRLTRLPLRKTGVEGLKPFGYELFDRSVSTFAPVTNVPVPANYVVGPGDRLEVQLYGGQNRNLRLTVERDGHVSIPELGPVNVAGQLFTEVKQDLESRVERQMIGVHASVTMADTRSIRVFVLGEARRPGSYTISGLGTITSALFASGGIKTIGSLRNIQLKRQGSLVRRLDLYDLLIRGDTTDDTRLLPGDVIFVPPVAATVSIEGEVRRPAIYEIKNESKVGDLLDLAGGMTPEADRANITLTRIDERQRRVVLQVDGAVPFSGAVARNGDRLHVSRLRPTLDSGVLVQGHVFNPGVFAYRSGLRLTDVIHSVDELRPESDIHYLIVRRELPPDRRISVLSADLAAALKAPGSAANLELMPRDRIIVFDLASGRDRVIEPLLDELRVQSNLEKPTESVHVDGRVKVPGEYPLENGMTVADLVRAGGGLGDAAYRSKAELTRYEVVDGETRRTTLINIDLAAALRGDATANVRLEPFDNLSIKEVSQWTGQESITLSGEVRFPGRYSIKRGETLRSVIDRAGGLTDFAFPQGSVFTREELRVREQEQLDLFASRMQKDLTILALQGTAVAANTGGGGNAAGALSVGQSLLSQLRAAKAVGRLVIDLPQMLSARAGSNVDVILRDGDRLIVPRLQQEVSVIGEVQNATSHLYSANLSRDDYISMSGGLTRRADHKSIYVVRANGNVMANHGNRWFEHSQVQMRPGDTIVVPLDAERLPPLPYWQAVTSILYNVAIAVAAVHAL
jgi:polysaccharide biosynthesis/export protein